MCARTGGMAMITRSGEKRRSAWSAKRKAHFTGATTVALVQRPFARRRAGHRCHDVTGRVGQVSDRRKGADCVLMPRPAGRHLFGWLAFRIELHDERAGNWTD